MLATVNRVLELERKAFVLFKSNCTDDYKRLVIYLVYATVKQNPGISQNKLSYVLKSEYNLDKDSVISAVGSLTSSEIFNVMSTYTLSKEKSATQPTLLRLSRTKRIINEWINHLNELGHAAIEFKAIKV